jgi:drug/metabolite transporter (DMT)-like permease
MRRNLTNSKPLRRRPAAVQHKPSLHRFSANPPDPLVPRPLQRYSADTTARLMLVALSLGWGSTWVTLKIALDEIPPFGMRTATCAFGAVTLFALAFLQHRDLRIRSTAARLHLVVSGCLSVAAFTLLSAFALVATTTSRVAVLTYTMPIWASLLAYLVLGERLNASRGIALALCAAGLCVLSYPLAGTSDLVGILIAVSTAVSWAAGTVYVKWAQVNADPMAIAAWQVAVALLVCIAGLLLFEEPLHLWPMTAPAFWSLVFAGIVGSGFAYLLWFEVVRRLPATTASLGVLSAPVVGVIASVLVLGERPSLADGIGFALILAAAACVLLAPSARPPRRVEPTEK